jgi:hypothetical protein
LPLEWIAGTDDQDLTPELQRLKSLWLKIVKKGRKNVGDECLVYRIQMVNDYSHVAHLDTKKTATSKIGKN